MGRGRFTEEEQEILKGNKHVILVTDKAIYYTNEFKLLFIKEYLGGKKPAQIFQDAGFDLKMLGSKRIERAAARWKESYQSGTLGTRYDLPRDPGKKVSKKAQESSNNDNQRALVECCHMQENMIKDLTAEVKLLRMIRETETEETDCQISKEKLCQLIQELSEKEDYRISTLCKAAGIHHGTFYSYRKKMGYNE